MGEGNDEENTVPKRKCRGCIIPPSAVIVASGFLINTIYGGLSYTPGLYLNSLLETYKAGKSLTAWTISIQGSFTYFAGLVAGPLVARFGTRLVAVIGAVCCTLGYLLSAFSPSVTFLYLTYGVLTGTGFGFLLISNGVAVQQHTSERRALAGGIAFVGSGLGAFIMPLVTKWAILNYGWRGSLIFLSGLLSHTLPCGLLLRPPPPCLPPQDEFDIEEKVDFEGLDIKEPMALPNIALIRNEDLVNSKLSINGSTVTIASSTKQKSLAIGSTLSLPAVYGSTLSINRHNQLNKSRGDIRGDNYSSQTTRWQKLKDLIIPMFQHEEPLLTPVSMLCLASFFFYFAGMPVLYVFMDVKGLSMGFELSAGATLMSFTGIGEVSGRILGAVIGTLHSRLPLIIYCCSSILAGISTVFITFCTTYSHMVWTGIAYGVGIGMSTSMSTTALRDLVGINLLPLIVGLAYTFGGIGNLLSIQTLVYAWEETGSFSIPYLAGGGLLIMSAVSMMGAQLAIKNKNIEKEQELEIQQGYLD